MLVLHPEMLSPQPDQGIEWVFASYVCSIFGVKVRGAYGNVGAILGATSVILVPNFDDVGAVSQAMGDYFGQFAKAATETTQR